jgi:hypothetical protein
MPHHRRTGTARTLLAVAALALGSAGLTSLAVSQPATGATAAPAAADTPQPTFTAQPLPTWQTNGVVYATETVGNVVYVGGNFTAVRPPGSAAGQNEVARRNIAAFNATTGDLLPFSHNFRSPNVAIPAGGTYDKTCSPGTAAGTYTCDTVYEIRASADGSKIYVGGDFEIVDNNTRLKVAAFSTATGNALLPWKSTSVSGRVRALAVSPTAVYLGGSFGQVNGQPRTRLAALDASTGALLPFTASADAQVIALALSPDNSRLILGGEFDNVNGQPIRGLAAVDATSGASARWDSRPIPRYSSTTYSYVTDLSVQGDTVYASANGEGGGVFDGRLSANVYTGELNWVDYCLGATWAIEAVQDLVYVGSHSHDCSRTSGGFPEAWSVAPPAVPRYYRLLALSTTGENVPTIQHWYPTTNGGIVGKLGPRDMTYTGSQLWVGGEFTTVNGVNQQGLTRFAMAPTAQSAAPLRPATPTASSLRAGEVRVSFQGTEDIDDAHLTYTVLRGRTTGSMSPIGTLEADSVPWALPSLSYVDSGLVPGETWHYQVQATDPSGRTSPKSYDTTVTVATTTVAYPASVLDDNPSLYWRLSDAAGDATAVAGPPPAYGSSVTRQVTGPLDGVEPSDRAVSVNGTSNGLVTSSTSFGTPGAFTAEAWFKAAPGTTGKLFGFGNAQTGMSGSYDRHVYLQPDGRLVFGVYPDRVATIVSPASYTDNQWHLVTVSLGAGGMRLYVDGGRVATDPSVTNGQNYSGYWRVGGDNLGGWPNTGGNAWFTGGLDEFAVYPGQLTDARVASRSLVVDPDSTPPSVPDGLTAKAVGTTVSATWTASSDDRRVDGYDVYLLPDAGTAPSPAYKRATVSDPRATIANVDPGTYVVRVVATDVAGNRSAASAAAPVTVSAPSPYAQAVVSDGASMYWPLDDTGSTASSVTGPTGTYGSGVTQRVAGAPINGVESAAIHTNGTPDGIVVADDTVTNPVPYSEEVWFRTSTTSGGKIVGLGNAAAGASSNYDRHVIMLDDGRLQYGVWLGYTATVTSSEAYNNGAWHHLVATLGAGGLRLYVDGAEVAGDSGITSAQGYTGRWRIGGDTTWGGASSSWINADLDELAIYPNQLSAAQVAQHYALAGATVDTTPPSAPTGLGATLDSGNANLAWTAATDAGGVASYRVYRLDSASATPGPATLIGTVSGTSYSDTAVPDGHWWYRVVAVDGAGNVGPASAAADVTVSTPHDPVVVTLAPTADAWTDASNPTTNRGNAWALSSDGTPVQRSYLAFTLPAAPAGTSLVSAVLKVSTTDNSIAGSANDQNVSLSDGTAWTELGLTDQNKPGLGATIGTLPGGSAASTAYDVALQQASLVPGLGGSVTLVVSTPGGDALQVVSDEDPNASRRPRLVLTFQ